MQTQIDTNQPKAISCKSSAKSHWLFIVFLTATLLLTGCYTLVDHEMPKIQNIPTVNAILQDGESLMMQLSMSADLDTVPLSSINNADIELWVNHVFVEKLAHESDGLYTAQSIVEAGREYCCKVVVPGFDTLFCLSKIPAPEQILGIHHINIAGKDEEGTSHPALEITFSNKPDIVSYYEIQINMFDYDNEVSYPNIINVVDPVILNEGLPVLLFSNELITDSVYTMYINYDTGGSYTAGGSTFRTILEPFVVELRTVNYDYYRFRKQYYLYEQGRYADGVIETMTSAPLYSNIENGTGIFAGYSCFVSDTIKPSYEL
jgi:hypothetical protein